MTERLLNRRQHPGQLERHRLAGAVVVNQLDVEALSDGTGPLPSPDEAGRQVAAASVRGVQALIGRGLLVTPGE